MKISDLFPDILPTDYSKHILDTLFGPGWDSLLTHIGSSGMANPASNMILNLLAAMSIVCMGILASLTFFMTLRGAIGTSSDGTPLGKQYHSLWVPLRLATGISLLAPVTKSGLSLMMVIVLHCFTYSISFANTLYNTGLDFLEKSNGQVLIHVPESLEDNTHEIARGILKSLVLQYYEMQEEDSEFGSLIEEEVIQPSKKNKKGYTVLFFTSPKNNYDFLKFKMGLVKIPLEKKREGDQVHTARRNNIIRLIRELQPVAKALVSRGSTYNDDLPLDQDAFFNATKNYNQKMMPYLQNIAQTQKHKDELKFFIKKAKEIGWVSAGSYYWTISRFSQNAYKDLLNKPEYIPPDSFLVFTYHNDDLQAYFKGVDSYIDRSVSYNDSLTAARGGTNHSSFSINDFFYKNFQVVGFSKIVDFLCKGDPIQNMSSVGHNIINATYSLWTAYAALTIFAESTDKANSGAWGKVVGFFSFGGSEFATGALKGVATIVSILVFIVSIPALALGFTLAYYLPSLPFIMWVGAVTGWCILIIETLFAAPLWALGHSLPEGEGFVGEKGKTGYLLFLGVLATPPLMICGFFSSLVLIHLIGFVIGKGFLIFSVGMGADYTFGLTATMAMTAILAGLLSVLSHRVFGIVVHLPENVVRWIGGSSFNLIDPGDETKTRAIFGATVAKGENSGSMLARENLRKNNNFKNMQNLNSHTGNNYNQSKNNQSYDVDDSTDYELGEI